MTKYFLQLLILMAMSANLWSQETKLTIAVTSDIHGRFFPQNHLKGDDHAHSLAAIHAKVEELRAEREHVILLDNGDLLQGTPAAYYAAYQQDGAPQMFSRMMNYMRYDAATVGNHDIECGPKVYNQLKQDFNFPYLGANVINEISQAPHFQPYTVLYKGGVKIAILGLTTPSVPNWLPPHLYDGLTFEDMVESARKWVGIIMENERPDLLIGLFHSGIGKRDVAEDEHPLENACAHIAHYVPGFDIVITGHDHGKRNELTENVNGSPVQILGPRHHAEYLGIVELTFQSRGGEKPLLSEMSGYHIPIDKDAISQGFMEAFSNDIKAIDQWAKSYVCHIPKDVDAISSLFGPAQLTDIIHAVQLRFTEADISFTAPLSFNDTLRQGDLYMRDLFKLYPFENYLYTMSLTGQEILNYLEYSAGGWFNKMTSASDHLLNFRKGADGQVDMGREGSFRLARPYYSLDGAAGVHYTVDVTEPPGKRIQMNNLADGRSFELSKTYKVAINSYRGSGGGNHLIEGAGIQRDNLKERIVTTSDVELRSLIGQYLKEQKEDELPQTATWQVIPQTFVERAIKSDIERLLMSKK